MRCDNMKQRKNTLYPLKRRVGGPPQPVWALEDKNPLFSPGFEHLS
jgi:hypothetical protein